MEPIAHYGVRDKEEDFLVKIKWTNGEENTYQINEVGKTYTYTQK